MSREQYPDWSAPEGKVRILFESGHRLVEILVPVADVRLTGSLLAKGGAVNMTTVDDKGDIRSSFDYPE